MLHNLRHQPLPRKPNPKPQRPGKRQRVTLIGAFRYGSGTSDSGVVICADSLEQLGSYRAFVRKIEARSTDLYDMVIAGAGNSSDLIDDQIEALVESIRGWQNEISEE